MVGGDAAVGVENEELDAAADDLAVVDGVPAEHDGVADATGVAGEAEGERLLGDEIPARPCTGP